LRHFLGGPTIAYDHLPELTIIERDAFIPFLFKNDMMPVDSAPALREIGADVGGPIDVSELISGAETKNAQQMRQTTDADGIRRYWGGWPEKFEYAIELSFGAHPQLPSQLVKVASGHFFNIYRVIPRSSRCGTVNLPACVLPQKEAFH
jgi:hypothetical protein